MLNKLVKSVLFLVVFSGFASAAEHKVLVNIMPLSVLSSSDADGFRNYYNSGNYFSYGEEIDGKASVVPNISAGYSLGLPHFSLDATAGIGYIANGAFNATYSQAEVGTYLTTERKGFMIGPFVRYVNISDPEWDTDNLVMTGTTATAFGISMMTGGSKVKFKVSVSKLSGADLFVAGQNGYSPSSNILSLDGTMVELGIALRF